MACKASTAWLDGDSRHKREHWRELFLPAPDSPLGHLIDGCFVVLLLLAPLLMGGRHPWGQLTWMAIAVMLGLGLFMRLPPRRPGTTDLLWSAAISLLLFQLIPLPVGWLTSLNPGLGTLVPAYAGAEPLPWSDQLLVAHPLSIN